MFNLFKNKKKKDDHPGDRYFKMSIKEVRKETDDANTIIFEKPEVEFHYKPGQFLTLILPIGDEKVRRSYSLCTSPYTEELPAITVKRVEEGKVSNYLNDHLKAGDVFDVMEPMGHFTPDLQEDQKKHYVLFAGGSGITPLISILKSVLLIEPKSKVTLINQNRNEHQVIFAKELSDLKKQYVDRFAIYDVFSQPIPDWKGYTGRLTGQIIKEIIDMVVDKDFGETAYFICGPAGMMQTVEEKLSELAVPAKSIHKESFFNTEEKEGSSHDVSQDKIAEQVVTIILDGEEHKVTVSPKKSILEAALDANLDMPFSCQSGICTACRGKLLQGKVYMEEDEGLTEEEIQEGYVLNCMGHPLTDDVKIEIG